MPKKKPPVTGRVYRGPGARLAIVRANLKLLKRLHAVRDVEGTGWWTAEALEYLKFPKRFAEQLMHTCWACGTINWDGPMDRAHVVACCEGGDDLPSNYFLLCCYCHEEQPEASARQPQEEWLENREYSSDRTWRHAKEFMGRLVIACGGLAGFEIAGRALANLNVRDVAATLPQNIRAMRVLAVYSERLDKRVKGRSVHSTRRIIDAKIIRLFAYLKERAGRGADQLDAGGERVEV